MNEYISSSNSYNFCQFNYICLLKKILISHTFGLCSTWNMFTYKLIVTNSNQSNNWLNFITDGFFPCKIGAISLPFFWKVDFSSSHLQRQVNSVKVFNWNTVDFYCETVKGKCIVFLFVKKTFKCSIMFTEILKKWFCPYGERDW